MMHTRNNQPQDWSTDDLIELQKARALWEEAPLKALTLFKRIVKSHPRHVTAILDAARALGSAHQIPQAKELLDQVADYALQTPEGAEQLGQSYRMAKMPDEAVKFFKRAIDHPDQLESVIELVVYYERRHQIEAAQLYLEPALQRHPKLAPLVLLKARLLRREKDQAKALCLFHRVAMDESAHFYHRAEAYYEVANLEDAQGDYQSAYKAACQAKKLMLPMAKQFLAMGNVWRSRHQEMLDVLTPGLIESWRKKTPTKAITPTILTGCPRSGTTLFEQMIGTHPQVQSFDELDIFSRFLYGTMLRDAKESDDGGKALLNISPLKAKQARHDYWKLFANHETPSKECRVLLDKNPASTGQIPVYLRMLPDLKILYALRDPRDVAVSSFLRFLPMNNISAHFLKPQTTVRWIAEELALWDSLKSCLDPSQWREIRYENTVRDLRSTISGALEFLDLKWDSAIDHYHDIKTRRPVNSPTYLEVTQPIHQRSLGRWKNYDFAFEKEFEKHADEFQKWGY